ncbi:DoxX-like protein [Rhodococcus sp. OK519]|uniref:DoxX family protein n=1 Tax=Rhodococcus sp. OK519 TaxID=2135729 RepID=UPI000D3B2866|nr:DoxX-like protein [Rhodococcus sp. OK519]
MTAAFPHTRTAPGTATVSPRARLVGLVVTGLVVAFLVSDAVIHLANIQAVRDSMVEYGFPDYAPYVMGIVMLVCLALYLLPVTSILGAVLLTGYLGGAVACNILTEQPLFSTILSPVYVGIFVWGGLYLRDARVRTIMPLVRG